LIKHNLVTVTITEQEANEILSELGYIIEKPQVTIGDMLKKVLTIDDVPKGFIKRL